MSSGALANRSNSRSPIRSSYTTRPSFTSAQSPTRCNVNNTSINTTAINSTIPSIPVPTADLTGLTAEQRDLFDYYRARISSFESERADFIRRIDELSGTSKERHRLKWDLNKAADAVADLQRAISDQHVQLYEEKAKVLALTEENNRLKIQEMEDQNRIKHLLALAQPVSQEITYFRDARPELIHRNFTIQRQNIIDQQEESKTNTQQSTSPKRQILATQPWDDNDKRSLAAIVKQSTKSTKSTTTKSTRPQTAATTSTNTAQVSPTRRQAFGQRITGQKPPAQQLQQRVVRTIYMPNESVDILKNIIEQMRTQAQNQTALYEERVKSLQEDRVIREKEHKEELQRVRSTVQDLQQDITKLNNRNEHTTKDYLHLRHKSQQIERQLKEEKFALQQNKTKLSTKLAEKEAEAKKAKEEREQEHEQYINLYRKQTSASEEDLAIIKAQYAATQELYEKRIRYLEERLNNLKQKYKQLQDKRELEYEGFNNELKIIRNNVKNIEQSIIKIKMQGIANSNNFPISQQQIPQQQPQSASNQDNQDVESIDSHGYTGNRLLKQFSSIEREVQNLQQQISHTANKLSMHKTG